MIVQVTKCGWFSEDITLYLLLPIVRIWGLLVGLGEAEPLDLRYQAEPGNEGMREICGLGEAEPLDLRYQAEPGNEGSFYLNYYTIAIMVSRLKS